MNEIEESTTQTVNGNGVIMALSEAETVIPVDNDDDDGPTGD